MYITHACTCTAHALANLSKYAGLVEQPVLIRELAVHLAQVSVDVLPRLAAVYAL